MRSFNHIVLDLELKKPNLSSNNWLDKLAANNEKNVFLLNVNVQSKISVNKVKTFSTFESANKANLKIASYSKKTKKYDFSVRSCHQFSINDLLNINFLRKERLYTKLKYSRSPAYDIVSGGAAALLAGFIGFLISEKFGFELVDSGDFYYLFIYVVFASFSIRPLLTTMNSKTSLLQIFSLKETINFFTILILLVLKKIKL